MCQAEFFFILAARSGYWKVHVEDLFSDWAEKSSKLGSGPVLNHIPKGLSVRDRQLVRSLA